jgi:hypothetical protein
MTAHIQITRPGSLLSVIAEQDITDSQASSIVALLKADGLTYGEVLRFLADRAPFARGTTETIYRTREEALKNR